MPSQAVVRELNMHETLKIAVVSDIHHGPDCRTKKGTMAGGLLRDFCSFAGTWQADIVVDLGDRISDVNHGSDLVHLQEVAEIFQAVPIPRVHLLGNHDVEHLSSLENQQLLKAEVQSQVISLKGFTLVFWQANTNNFWPSGLNLQPKDLAWLEQTLEHSPGPCIVFTHVPLDSGSMASNFYYANNPRYATYPEAARAREIIEQSEKVILCIAGHVHWNSLNQVNGIPYLTLHSLTESSTTLPQASRAWATVALTDAINIAVSGLEPRSITLPIRNTAQKFLTPLRKGFTHASENRTRPGLSSFKTFLFDLDGVFYRGEDPLPGGRELIEYLKTTARQYLAVTNNAQLLAADFSDRLREMKIDFPLATILTSSEVLRAQLLTLDPEPKVFILGSDSFRQYLAQGGVVESAQPDYVVAAWNSSTTMSEMEQAVSHLLKGARLVATNEDCLIPTADGPRPENGALVAFLEKASGKQATIYGKPNPLIFKEALHRLGADPATTIFVGDTLETDILGANLSGLYSAYLNPAPSIDTLVAHPSYTLSGLAELLKILRDEA